MNNLNMFDIPLEGTHLIEASAGTGKTYTIASLYVRLLLEKAYHVREILVVTYTVPATDELKSRIREKIRAALQCFESGTSSDPFLNDLLQRVERHDHAVQSLEFALRRFDEAAIFTIHGFCQRVLSEMAFESRSLFESELITDQVELLKEVIGDFYRRHFSEDMPPELVSYASRKGYTFGFLLRLIMKASLDASVIPDMEKPEAKALLEAYRLCFEQLKSSWPHAKEEVILILMNDPGLNRSRYKQQSIPRITDEMDAYVASGGYGLPLFKDFEKLTSSFLLKSIKKGFTPPGHAFFSLCERLKQQADELSAWMDIVLVWLKAELFRCVRKNLPEKKEGLSLVHFDDLLLKVYQSLSSESGDLLREIIAERYQAALIDEFQDTDPIQYEIFKSFFSGAPLFLIGDPKQAIYSFRGADIFTYLNASAQVEKGYRHTLDKNWRSEPGLLDAVNRIFRRELPFVFEEIAFEPVSPADIPDREFLRDVEGAPLTLWYVPGNASSGLSKRDAEKRISLAVAWEVSRLLKGGGAGEIGLGERPVVPRDIALIVRENSQGRLLKDVLTFCGIPCVIYSDENIFDSNEAVEMELLLKAVSEPYSESCMRTALAGSLFNLDALELDSLSHDEQKLERWIEKFRGYHDLWAGSGFVRMFRKLMTEEGVSARLLNLPRGERMLTNFLHLQEVLGEASMEEKFGMRGLLKWLSQQRDPAMPRQEEHQLRLESDEDAVKIITVHKSKGLEFPIVFCPFLWGSSDLRDKANIPFHDAEHGYKAFLDVGSEKIDEHRMCAEKELLAENMRLVYVALTRARNRCYLVWGRFNKGESSALSYLFRQQGKPENRGSEGDGETAHTDDHSMRHDLELMCNVPETGILIRDLPGMGRLPDRYERTGMEGVRISCRDLSREIDRSWRVASFSSMISGTHLIEEADRDSLPQIAEIKDPGGEEGMGDIFSFPRGARAGTMIHEIFELIDFQADDGAVRSLVAKALELHGFDLSWRDVLAEMVRKVLTVQIGDFHLSDIKNAEALRELEFYLPAKKISPHIIREAFETYGKETVSPGFTGMIEGLTFEESTGYLRGFIDLVFSRNGRYYLVDWKSNHLGSSPEDYTQQALHGAMEKNYYVLQYHIYTLALHHYLKQRIKDYSYARHFGGIIYMFIRGVDPEKGPDYGIYRKLPSEGLIEYFSGMLARTGEDRRRDTGHEIAFE